MNLAKTIKNVVASAGLAAVLSGCVGRLRMNNPPECPGVTYTEWVGSLLPYNLLDVKRGDTVFTMIEYSGEQIDWRKKGEEDSVKTRNINKVIIDYGILAENYIPGDSSSRMISGKRAKQWLDRGTQMYRDGLSCFVGWKRAEEKRHHLF